METPRWAQKRIREAKEQNLSSLNLSLISGNWKIRKIPEEPLTEIPPAVFELSHLSSLLLDGNNLTDIPDAIGKLPNLVRLSLTYNKLASLPKSIINLQNLTSLYLRDNNFADLPRVVTELKSLVWLDVANNPLVTPPLEVAQKGVAAIREYARQLDEEGEDQLYEAKLLILGEGGAGKTTLARKIESSTYILKDEKSTEGVDVTKWSFPIDSNRSFRVNIWDFGGQEIYHATHQFFLTRRSLYTLVADTRKEDTDFYYWLNIADLLSDNSPLLIIKNEKQDRHRDLNERQLRGQFENLQDVLSVNLATNRGLDSVRETIKYYIKSLPHIGSPLPKTWVQVRKRLEEDSRNYISLDEYLEICRENGFREMKDSLQLSNYLHDIGVFLHFQDDPLLEDTIILKPKWGTDAVYKVLDNKTVIKNLGRFTYDDLKLIWSTSDYESIRGKLLQLMMKFKLCYEIPAQKGIYIAPQLLTENQPEYQWDKKDNLLLRYDYEFMPKGILLQFIVSINRYIAVVNKHSLVWRSGVVIAKDQTAAEVVEYYGKHEIHVQVAGAHKKELLSVIMHEFDKIHGTYTRLRYDRLIPCNCAECKTSQEPYFYRFEILQKFIEDKQDQIQCQQSYKMVNVRGLIDDVLEKEHFREKPDGPMAQYIIHGNYIDQGDKKMTSIKQSVTNSTVHGSVVAAESIKDSFNTIEKADIKDDLKDQLKQLTEAVDAMIKELPREKAEEVAEDLKVLAEQAVKEKPNPKWYNVSVDGLVAAAQNLGKVGDSVVELSGKVRKILTGGIL